MTVEKWRLYMAKDGTPTISYEDVKGVRRFNPQSDELEITDRGIEFDIKSRRGTDHIECLFKNLDMNKHPIPVKILLEVDKVKGCVIERLRSHILGFIYELAAGVWHSKVPYLIERPIVDIEALLAQYPQFKTQLSDVDWHAVVKEF